jgi:hypothetical protein
MTAGGDSSCLFIDGGFVEALIPQAAKFYNLPLKIDDIDFGRISRGFQRTFYYDALPVQKDGEDPIAYEQLLTRKRGLFSRINTTRQPAHAAAHVDLLVSARERRNQRRVGLLRCVRGNYPPSLQAPPARHLSRRNKAASAGLL